MPPGFTPSERGIKQPFPAIFFGSKCSFNFYKKVLEMYYPPLGGVNFELNTYSDFRGRIVFLFSSRKYGIIFLHKVNKEKLPCIKALRSTYLIL